MSTKNRTRRTTTRNIRFPNQMIEQINIALEQKGSGNFSAWVIEACRRRLCSEKRVSSEANKEKSDITELLRKQVRPDWSNLDNRADYAPSYHMEGLSMDQVVIFKQIFDKVRNDLNYQWFYSCLLYTSPSPRDEYYRISYAVFCLKKKKIIKEIKY